ncbi:hypothetical protein PMG11_03618 [Penicillium brasilianum]|uniref:Uncharacterized protein n=1 Tax=Penicillium brasilianum TaxID=104259 RepID=A0A0F7VE03_PENBI|nr:hypothetical protein PMG11_03618 [Penicillium brasilianum]
MTISDSINRKVDFNKVGENSIQDHLASSFGWFPAGELFDIQNGFSEALLGSRHTVACGGRPGNLGAPPVDDETNVTCIFVSRSLRSMDPTTWLELPNLTHEEQPVKGFHR